MYSSGTMKSAAFMAGFCLIGSMLSGCRTRVPDGMKPTMVPDMVQSTEVVAVLPTVGTITLIRIEPEPVAEELLVYTNGVLLAVIGNYSYATLELPGGSHLMTFDWDDTPMAFEEELVLDLTETTNQYLSVRHQFDVPEISRTESGTDYTMVETLAIFEVSETYGRSLISRLDPDCSYVFGPDE